MGRGVLRIVTRVSGLLGGEGSCHAALANKEIPCPRVCGRWLCAVGHRLCGCSIATGHHATIYAMTLLDVINLNSERGNVTVFVLPGYVARLLPDTQRQDASGEARALQAIPSQPNAPLIR